MKWFEFTHCLPAKIVTHRLSGLASSWHWSRQPNAVTSAPAAMRHAQPLINGRWRPRSAWRSIGRRAHRDHFYKGFFKILFWNDRVCTKIFILLATFRPRMGAAIKWMLKQAGKELMLLHWKKFVKTKSIGKFYAKSCTTELKVGHSWQICPWLKNGFKHF